MALGPKVALSIDAGDIGWVRFELRIGAHEFTQHVGDLTDLLGDLLRATLAIVRGRGAARCVLDLEPGECRIDLRRSPNLGGALGVSISFALPGKVLPEVRAAKAYHAECTVNAFAAAVLAEADALLSRGGIDAFEERWDRPYPCHEVAELREALRAVA